MAKKFSVEAVFKAVDRVTVPVTRMQNAIGKMTRSVEAGVRRLSTRTEAIGNGIKSGALYAAAGLGTMSVAMADIIRVGSEFEQTLTNAAAKFDGDVRKGTPAFKALEDAARKTGATTEFSATQSAEALNSLAMAGFGVESAVAALPLVVDLATAAQISLATATDVAADSLGAFNLNSKDSNVVQKNLARVSDVLGMTANATNTSIELMYETVKEAGPVAAAAGISIETFSALAGELANSTLKGSKAGTTLKNMFLRLQAPTARSAKMMKSLGLNLAFLSDGALDPVQTLENLRVATKNLSATQKAAALDQLFGSEAISGVNILLASGTDKINASIKKLREGGGSIKSVADIMRNTLTGRFKELKATVEGVKIDIFSKISGPLSEVVKKITVFISKNKELITSKVVGFLESVAKNLSTIVTWVERVGIAIAIFIVFSNILKTFVLVMSVVNIIMAMNPIGLIVLGVLALIAGFTVLIVWIEDISKAFDLLPDSIKTNLAFIWAIIGAIKYAKKTVLDFLHVGKGKQKFDMGALDRAQQTLMVSTQKPQVLSPQERIARTIEEKKTSAEILISDMTNAAKVQKSTMGKMLTLQKTGAF